MIIKNSKPIKNILKVISDNILKKHLYLINILFSLYINIKIYPSSFMEIKSNMEILYYFIGSVDCVAVTSWTAEDFVITFGVRCNHYSLWFEVYLLFYDNIIHQVNVTQLQNIIIIYVQCTYLAAHKMYTQK